MRIKAELGRRGRCIPVPQMRSVDLRFEVFGNKVETGKRECGGIPKRMRTDSSEWDDVEQCATVTVSWGKARLRGRSDWRNKLSF